jgi:hypothetical protein
MKKRSALKRKRQSVFLIGTRVGGNEAGRLSKLNISAHSKAYPDCAAFADVLS